MCDLYFLETNAVTMFRNNILKSKGLHLRLNLINYSKTHKVRNWLELVCKCVCVCLKNISRSFVDNGLN